MPDRLYDPEEITRRSYNYIDRNLELEDPTPLVERIIRRVVHTTGDFEMKDTLWFSEGIESGFDEVLESSLPVVTDVSMVESGIRNSLLKQAGLRTDSFVHDSRARDLADDRELTRSAAGLDLALETYDRFMLVVGNAPTVLFRLLDREDVGPETVPLVVGAPVGFISVEESKTELRESTFTSVGVTGNRGGSPVAASMTNALIESRMRDNNE